MKRKVLSILLAGCMSGVMAVGFWGPVMAEETETGTEAETETVAAETETAGAETETEAPETEAAVLERPDYTASDYVSLGEYKGLVVSPSVTEVTDENVQDEIEYYVQLADAFEVLTEGAVEDGDIANIDYVGTLDGEAFDGGTSKGYDLTIGSGTFIDGFEDGLIGVAIGDTVDLNLTFPENYYSSDLAGQEVVFTVTVNEVQRMPELTDELVNTVTEGEYTDVESYESYIRSVLEADMETQREYLIQTSLLTQVANTSEILDYPQEMVDYGYSNMRSFYEDYAEQLSMEFADFVSTYFGMTEDEFEDQAIEAVKQNLEQELYLKAIAENEGIEVSDEEYAAGSEKYAEAYGFDSAEELIASYGESTVRISILQEKVLEFLEDNAVIEEPEETEDETADEEVSEDTAKTEEGSEETETEETESEPETEETAAEEPQETDTQE